MSSDLFQSRVRLAVAFAGIYVLATATIGVVLMKESKRFGRALFRPPRLAEEEAA